ncbi:MAG: flagellar hook-basal body complex protein, partial [Lachnospiraceae bacterium]|nr:flagellar hook-basal body complex protein [Lachnospiraceae bacterium]
MMRALWSAASGMITQQTNVDTIANNISNVNTTGFKGDRAEFKSLLYQTMQARTTTANGARKPVPAQVGLGTRLAAVTTSFSQGSINEVDSPTAFAIEGQGLFGVMGE